MTIRHLPDLLKRPHPLNPSPRARMHAAMGMPPPTPQPGLAHPAPPADHAATAEQDLLQSWLHNQCGWR